MKTKKSSLSTLLIFCRAADVQEKLHNEALTEYEADCTNPDLEKRVDEAYKDYYNACREIADKLVEVTNKKIDKPTALQMAFEKRAEITYILS